MDTYYYRDSSGKGIGPFELDTLAKMRLAGVLSDNTLTRFGESTEWKPLNQFLPSSLVPPIPQKSPNIPISRALVGLLVVVVVILIAWHLKSSSNHNVIDSTQAQMNQIAAAQQAQADKSIKEMQPAKKSLGAQQASIEHAADAERDFRSEMASDNPRVKLVSFRATTGQLYYETNLLNLSITECYKLNYETEFEYEQGGTGNGITINPGDRIKCSGTMNGKNKIIGGLLNSWQFKNHDLHIIGGSNPSLVAAMKANEEEAQAAADKNTCINNLRQIDAAKQQWALEKGKKATDVPTKEDLLPFLHSWPVCPDGGTYSIGGAIGENPTCSIPGHTLPQ